MKKAARVFIFGTVQGVFFRSFLKEKAEKLCLKGYVRNKEDGSLEGWFEGDSEKVDEMLELCKKGPDHAIIKRLDIVEENLQDMKDFKILNI